ncbi:MAG: HlyD family efflux transporter periplasmic adaptor subunit [Myxococcota bacterium]|nr:HlyD family efflux transporter periplasmic adaptor subunit [Myxococcota bacterium]
MAQPGHSPSVHPHPAAPAAATAGDESLEVAVPDLHVVARRDYVECFETLASIEVPPATRVLAGMFVLSLLVGGAILGFTPWVQTSVGMGRVTALDPDARLQEITVLVGGRINRWFVRDGSRVKEGDPIVEIVDVDPRYLERLEAERAAVASKYMAARTASEIAKLDTARQEELFGEGLASRREFERARVRYEELASKEAQALAELNAVDVKLSRQSTQLVTAPRDGAIVSLQAGDKATLVKEGQTVATLAPSDVELAAELYVSGLDAPLIQPGRQLRLEFEGWPAVQFSGWPAVAVGTFGGVVASVDPSVSPNGRFRILVKEDPADPWPDDRYLRLGSQVKGWVLLNTVPLGYELWRQLNRFPPLPDPGAGPGDSSKKT